MAPLYAVGSMRVRRSYRGGALIERLAGRPAIDGDRPEDWIASAVRAVNPGLVAEPDEGLTPLTGSDGTATTLAGLLATDPAALLGADHLRRHGADLGFLAKLLDAGMRLHVQAHPTRAFARERLGSPHGKLEAYVILAVRPGCDGWIRLGFQRPPDRAGWRRIIADQDLAAMDACFDRIPVRPGETWLVPGGWPHAIGPGVLMLEVMEPSDLVVRCEFEREGIIVPPAGRFMGRDLEFCLDVFDYTRRDPDAVRVACRLAGPPGQAGACTLVGPQHTGCFTIRRCAIPAGSAADLSLDGRVALVLCEDGAASLAAAGAGLALPRLATAVVPARSGSCHAASEAGASLLIVQPGTG